MTDRQRKESQSPAKDGKNKENKKVKIVQGKKETTLTPENEP